MIIGLTLTILLVLTLLSFILGDIFIDVPMTLEVEGTSMLDESATTFNLPIFNFVLRIDPVAGLIVIFIVIIVIAGILGIQILASGLSPESIRFIMNAILYFGLWSLLSVMASGLILSIEIFGTIIYLTLTIAYVIGVLQKQTGGE